MGKIIITAGFEKLPKVQYITQSGYTGEILDVFHRWNDKNRPFKSNKQIKSYILL